MDVFDQALHLLNFVAPAWALALGLALATRLTPAAWGLASRRSMRVQLVLQGLLGSAVLFGGLALFGVDGKMATYGALVVLAASVQWCLVSMGKA